MVETDEFYPDVDLAFVCQLVEDTGRVIDRIKVGNTTAYILSGSQSIAKRTIPIRDMGDSTVDLNYATAIAFKLKLMGPLLAWLEQNRNWKEGGYIVPHSQSQS